MFMLKVVFSRYYGNMAKRQVKVTEIRKVLSLE